MKGLKGKDGQVPFKYKEWIEFNLMTADSVMQAIGRSESKGHLAARTIYLRWAPKFIKTRCRGGDMRNIDGADDRPGPLNVATCPDLP